ncbi:MAG: hypothetical protein RL510_876 [Actinomycetota bacterium]|jgi:restriction system protein
MTDYYRVMLGAGSIYAAQAFDEGWIGTGWLGELDLTDRLSDSKSDFTSHITPILMASDEPMNKFAAGMAASATWTLGRQMALGDVVISPNGRGQYQLGHIDGDYYYAAESPLPHRRPVKWQHELVPKEDISSQLRSSISVPTTVIWLKGYTPEIQAAYEDELSALVDGMAAGSPKAKSLDESISFVMERYLEEFLVRNWRFTELAADWDLVSSQEQTETGPLDILAQSKDAKTLLVIELKLRRGTDDALGQIQRYMGWIKHNRAEPGQEVKGLIIGTDKDAKLRWALEVAPDVSFMRYEMDFKLFRD